MSSRLGRRRRERAGVDERRQQRIAGVLEVVECFVYDLGLLISGRHVDFERYVDPRSAARLRDSVAAVTGCDVVTRPDFGEYAHVSIEGNLLDPVAPVRTVVEFDDRSQRVDAAGRAMSRIRRRVRLLLILDPTISRVIDHRVDVV